ncbi:3-deoxy-D-manno-octulosonic-acid transferase [biofilm metagenome]
MRNLYSVLFLLLTPFIILRLLWRSIKAPDYSKRWGERFGRYPETTRTGIIWIHAVSVGEAEAVFPLIKRLQQTKPTLPILVTTTTPTGSARVKAVLADTVQHVYLPYDIPWIVKRFLHSFRPRLAVIMETELWPNLFHYCASNKIPLYVINARLSEKSTKGYQKIPSLIHPLLANIDQIAAQTEDDAQRFLTIGAQPGQVTVCGNIKFDLDVPGAVISTGKELKAAEFKGRFVWLCASTHYGEEQTLINAYKILKPNIPDLLLVLVPRHPERFSEVESFCKAHKLSVISRTSKQPCNQETDVYLADTMGELKILYAAADVAFVGGSLTPVGGHNILEALAVGVPVLFGPYMSNFKEIAQKVVNNKAAVQCADQNAIVHLILDLFLNESKRDVLIHNGKMVMQKNRGVINKLYKMLIIGYETNLKPN